MKISEKFIARLRNEIGVYDSFEDFKKNAVGAASRSDENEFVLNSFALVFDSKQYSVTFEDVFCEIENWTVSTKEFWIVAKKLAN